MATPEQIRQFYQNESLKKYSSSGQRQQPLPKLENIPKNGVPKPVPRVQTPNTTPPPTVPTKPVTPEQIREYAKNEPLNKYNTGGQKQSPLPDLGKIPKTPSTKGSGGMATGGSIGEYAKFKNAANNAVKSATPSIPATATAAAEAGGAAVARQAFSKAAGAVAAWAAGGTATTVAWAAALAGPLVLLDPFSPQETEEDAMLKNLMPPHSPQKIEEGTYPFTGGQSKGVLYLVSWVRTWEHFDNSLQEWILKTEYTKSGVEGPINAFIIQEDPSTYKFIFKWGESNAEQLVGLLEKPNKDRNPTAKVLSIKRIDGLPDTSGNPPPITQPIYTTNITNNYNTIPAPTVNQKSESAPPIIITPIGAGAGSGVTTAPDPQILPSRCKITELECKCIE